MRKGLATNVAGTTLVLVPEGANEGESVVPQELYDDTIKKGSSQ